MQSTGSEGDNQGVCPEECFSNPPQGLLDSLQAPRPGIEQGDPPSSVSPASSVMRGKSVSPALLPETRAKLRGVGARFLRVPRNKLETLGKPTMSKTPQQRCTPEHKEEVALQDLPIK